MVGLNRWGCSYICQMPEITLRASRSTKVMRPPTTRNNPLSRYFSILSPRFILSSLCTALISVTSVLLSFYIFGTFLLLYIGRFQKKLRDGYKARVTISENLTRKEKSINDGCERVDSCEFAIKDLK